MSVKERILQSAEELIYQKVMMPPPSVTSWRWLMLAGAALLLFQI